MHKTDIPAKLNVSEDLNELISELGQFLKANNAKDVLVISGKHAHKHFTKDLIDGLNHINKIDIRCTSIDNQQDEQECKTHDWVIGIGGGKVLDHAKYYCKTKNCRFISIPTLIAHDGICSPVAVIDGKSVGALMPHALFVPLFIIEESPLIQIKAGVGDLIANLSAIDDWQLAAKVKCEPVDDFAIMLAKRAAINLIQKLELNYLKSKTKFSAEEFLRSKTFLSSLIESLALSGIAMSISGNSRPCSGGEHMISHAIDLIYGHGVKAPHGIQVLVATLFLEQFRKKSSLQNATTNISEFSKLLSDYGFPINFNEIGIKTDELAKILELAPQTRAGRYSILEEIKVKH